MAITYAELVEMCGVPRVLMVNPSQRVSDEPYLLIRSFISVPRRRFKEAHDQLEEMGIVVRRPGTRIGPLGGVVETVEVAVAADVTGFSREALDRAVAARRVLVVGCERCMGSASVFLYIKSPDDPVGMHGTHLLFEPPGRLEDAALPHAESFNHETVEDFLGWQWYFTRELPLPPVKRRGAP